MMPLSQTPTAFESRCSRRSAVAVISSAGGISALIELLSSLVRDFPLPLIIAQHLARETPSMLPAVLHWHSGADAKWAEDGEKPQAGKVYVIPPRHQMEIAEQGFRLSRLGDAATDWLASPDLLLRSLARQYQAGAVGVTLSGMIPLGIRGLRAIRTGGGITMAQSEQSAMHLGMPTAAIDFGKADIIFPPSGIGLALNILAEQEL